MDIRFYNRFLMIRLRKPKERVSVNAEFKTTVRLIFGDDDNEASIYMTNKQARALYFALEAHFKTGRI